MKVIALMPAVIAVIGSAFVALFGSSVPLDIDVFLPLFLGLAVATTVAALLLPRLVSRMDSVRQEVLLVALAAMLTTGATIAVSASVMILPPGQLGAMLVVAIMGAGLGIVVEYALARDLSADARRLRLAARRIARGDLAARSGVDRADEIGQAAGAIDTMAARLATLEADRNAAQIARQKFLSAVGHDLRAPISALAAALDAVEDGLGADPELYFAAIRQDMAALQRLSDDLFLLARIESAGLTFERIQADLSELADEAVEALRPTAARKGVKLRVAATGGAIAQVGTGEVSRTIRNLLDNAIRHAPPESEVVVELSQLDDGVTIRVIDRGEGFSDDRRDGMMDTLAQTEGSQPRTVDGRGLGLTIAKGLVDAHGGRMWIEAGPGGRVAMWIPTRS
ncbi:MAG: HAMP domain-containing histidine kinase [Chloroflexi bacterium]|nr:HAMP domain-containing histidine kinase [Chloroflexota bacterium]